MTFTHEAWLRSRESRRYRSDRAFWTHVERVGDCWEWTGPRQRSSRVSRGGYGFVVRFGKRVFAHRHAFALVNGPIPDGALVLHSCDNRPCVKPEHLSLGTHSENTQQMWDRGGRARG